MFRVTTVFVLLLLLKLSAIAEVRNDSLAHAIQTVTDEHSRYHAMVLLAGEIMPQYLDSARVLLEQSRSLSHEGPESGKRAAWFNIKGNYCWYTGQLDSAMMFYRRTFQMESPDIIRRKAVAAVNMGSLYNRSGEPDSVRLYLDKAIELFEEIDDKGGVARTQMSLGLLYVNKNNYELGLQQYLQSLEYNLSIQDTLTLVFLYNSLGNIYNNLDDSKLARYHYLEGLKLSRNIPEKTVVADLHNNLAHLYLNQLDNLDSALYYCFSGLELAHLQSAVPSVFSLYINLGSIYLLKKEYEEARQWFQKSMDLDQSRISKEGLTGSWVNYGNFFREISDYPRAEMYYTDALELAETIGSFQWQLSAREGLFKLDSLRGDYLAAIEHHQEARRLHDSIWQKERADRLAELDIIYQSELRKTENLQLKEANQLKEEIILRQQQLVLVTGFIIILFVVFIVYLILSIRKIRRQRDELNIVNRKVNLKQAEIASQNALLDKQKKELENLNLTKDKFFSIIAHDLRGPFHALMGYLDLLVERFDQMDDNRRKELLEKLQTNSHVTYELLLNLLEWSSIQRGSVRNDPGEVGLRKLIDNILALLDHSIQTKGHSVQNLVSEDHKVFVDPKLIQSVCMNLINNAIKFTPTGGDIRIESLVEGDRIHVCVTDNGMGIPEEQLDEIFRIDASFKREGTDKEQGTGLGLIMVKEFVSLMGGDISVKSKPGKGSVFCFILPFRQHN